MEQGWVELELGRGGYVLTRWMEDGGRWTVDGGWWMVDGGCILGGKQSCDMRRGAARLGC